MYLPGAPRFTIVTAHKPLLPMFSRPSVKLPPRIEMWVMDMEDVDFEMKYKPVRDELDPFDVLSRHPLPVIGNDDTEKVLKAAIRIREETSQDGVLRTLSQTIRKGNWESSKRDADLTPFYQVKEELYESQGMIFRMERIILPANLQQKIIKSAHTLGHLGTTKTKQMLREKYWFPGMNHLISQTIGSCFDCQVATKSHRQEPIKQSIIPEEPWEQISIDFGGPYPDGHYNLVAIDHRTRYPVVEVVSSTGFKQTKKKLKKTFAYLGIPRRVTPDNGPPFNSEQFKDFAKKEGFVHNRVTQITLELMGRWRDLCRPLTKQNKLPICKGNQDQTETWLSRIC